MAYCYLTKSWVKLSASSPEIIEAVNAWNAALERHARTGWKGHATDRRKYIALDEEVNGEHFASGHFLIDRETGDIWTIRGYGQRGGIVMNLRDWVAYWNSAPGRDAQRGAYNGSTGRQAGGFRPTVLS